MRTATALLHATLLAAGIGLLTVPVGFVDTPASAAPAPAGATEDIVYLNDGRVFNGRVISENRDEVVFEFIDRVSNIRTRLTFRPDQIMKIEREVPLEEGMGEPEADVDEGVRRPASNAASRPGETRFIDEFREQARSASDDPSLPGVYLIPMKGQMGTDIRYDVYEELLDDIRAHDPALVVWVLDCSDVEDGMIPMSDPREAGRVDLDQYRNLVNLLRDDLRDIPQVMWVHDSVGISSVIALAWDEMYMHPGARLAGLSQIYRNAARWSDEDVRAKMIAAWVGIANGFLETGGRDLELGRAMMDPNQMLSASWRGREVEWRLDKSGEYLVDGSEKGTVTFSAKNAVDLCVAEGRAEEIDDLMLLKGYREYRLIDGAAPDEVEKYVEDWRRALDRAKETWRDYEQHMGWASGQDTVKYLGRAKKDLERIVALMDRYPAVELRFPAEIGQNLSKLDLQTMAEQIAEQLRALRSSGGGLTGGGGGGRRGGGGPGESPR